MVKGNFRFEIQAVDQSGSAARVGEVHTAHGSFATPVFMPVGTRAVVKTMTPRELKQTGATIILGNTYHLAVRPGEQLIQRLGGLHRFMAWDGPILTDSGGFQVFSLADLRKLSDAGVTFRSHINGDLFVFTPERVIEIQQALGSDIMMPLDHCIGWPCTPDQAKEAARRSLDWLKRSLAVPIAADQALFAIVQGSAYPDLREWCAQEMVALDLPGYAIGGLAVGEPKAAMEQTVRQMHLLLPESKPRYLMGVGDPEDMLSAIAAGVDMFDCVIPTRNARSGGVFTWSGKLQIRNSCHREDPNPLERDCPCYCCRTFTRAYLHHLFSKKVQEIMGMMMLTRHNLTFFHNLLAAVRQSIAAGRYRQFVAEFRQRYSQQPQT